MSIITLTLTIKFQPYSEASDNLIEIANEATIFIVLALLMGYTD